MKKVSANDSIYHLVKIHPMLIDILVNLGFDRITKKGVLETVGRKMTLNKGIQHRNVDAAHIKKMFYDNGFILEDLV